VRTRVLQNRLTARPAPQSKLRRGSTCNQRAQTLACGRAC